MTDLEPLTTLQSLKVLALRNLPAVNLASLVTPPHLQELHLGGIDEPVDLSPLARTDHRLHVYLGNVTTVGDLGPLVRIHKT